MFISSQMRRVIDDQVAQKKSSCPRCGGGPAGIFRRPRPGIDRYQYGDGLFSAIGKFVKKVATGPVGRLASTALSLVPGGGLIKKGAMIARAAFRPAARIAGVGAAAVGAAALLPRGSPAGLPAIPGMGGYAAPTGGGGLLPWWRGPGGKMQFPWQDPQQLLQPPYAYDDTFLKITYRAPHGYVVVRDPQGRAYAMAKPVARAVGLWHSSRKPPISAGDWHKYMTAKSVEKKLRKLAAGALHHRARTKTVYVSKRAA